MKTPGTRVAGLSRSEFKDKIIEMSLKMFNIEHTKDTMVGDAFIRGVSGGERKRVSIAEMLTTSAAVCCVSVHPFLSILFPSEAKKTGNCFEGSLTRNPSNYPKLWPINC